jgi:hypothetical protein
MLAIDEGLRLEEGQNKSKIWAEHYYKIPASCTLARYFLQEILSTGRIRETNPKVDLALAQKINQMIAKRSDRIFLRVALNSAEKLFVSHDFKDFSRQKRADIRKGVGVTVCEAGALQDAESELDQPAK